MPLSGMLVYKTRFSEYGIHYINRTNHFSDEFLHKQVGMSMGVIKDLRGHVRHLIKRACKGKGQEVTLKCKGDDKNSPINLYLL